MQKKEQHPQTSTSENVELEPNIENAKQLLEGEDNSDLLTLLKLAQNPKQINSDEKTDED